ncbi:MAG TPA: IS5 family transposase, partial [Geminicoccaceae bacterium]|nr:IS5 family transposase [Geminicoccaceae bacterium]
APADRRHHSPEQRHRVTNRAAYDAGPRARGSLTVWFTPEASAPWAAAPRTTRGGRPSYADPALATALALRAVSRLARRQTEGLIASIPQLLGLDLAVPDHATLGRRAETLRVPRPAPGPGGEPVHPLVDGTGLRLCGPGEWLTGKHGGGSRRSWRKPHPGVDADTARSVAAALTVRDVDDGSPVGPWLSQVDGPVASFPADGADDRDDVYAAVVARHPDAAVIVPPRSNAVPSETAEAAPTRGDRHLATSAGRGRMGWREASGYNRRAPVAADIPRFKRVMGEALRSRTDGRRGTEVAIAVDALNRMPALGRPESVRIA